MRRYSKFAGAVCGQPFSLENIENEFDEHSFKQLQDPSPTPEEEFQEVEHAKIVKRALQGLSVQSRDALQLCQSKDCTLKEAANTLGLSVGTLKARLHHGRRALITQLKRETQGRHRRLLMNSTTWTMLPRSNSYL